PATDPRTPTSNENTATPPHTPDHTAEPAATRNDPPPHQDGPRTAAPTTFTHIATNTTSGATAPGTDSGTTDSGRTPATQNPASARTTHNSPNSQSPNTQNQDHNTNPE
ncbi:hypothetical protein, partial [Nocardiopsis sp. LOL_012]|uniref:hypothetical protein n=1 Tax=Nocardiopsis sp. LOL_012 TaxID=3345409 RepID=UPI003A8B31BA